MRERSGRRREALPRDEGGQATVEAALALPVVLLALFVVVEVGVVVRDVLSLGVAAREGAREAAVTADPVRARDAVRRSAGSIPPDEIGIDLAPAEDAWRRGDPVTVRLTYVARIRIPFLGRFVRRELPVETSATMRLERTGAAATTPSPAPTSVPSPTPSPTPIPAPAVP